MKQKYARYWEWEDYQNGMYEVPNHKEEAKLTKLAIKMLSNKELFLNTCKEVLINWTVSSPVNLTNKQCNRKAWLGQAACSYKYKVPEICTRNAWGKLSKEQQNEANKVAEKIITSFELNYEKKDNQLYC